MEKQNLKAWLYLLPAFLFLGAFMIYPLIDVFVYSFEEGYNSHPKPLRRRHVQLLLCAPRSVLFTGIEKYLYSGHHHRSGLHRTGAFDLRCFKLHQTVAGSVPDHIFPALCDQYSGGRSGLHDSFQKDSLLRRSDQSADPVFRRQLRGFHRRTLLGENVRAVLLHHLDRYAL